MSEWLEKITSNCVTCKKYAKTPAKRVLSLLRARCFNDLLSLDLKKWRGKIILYMIDHWRRLTFGCIVKSKRPFEIVDAVLDICRLW